MKQLLLTAFLTINMAIGFGQINIDSLHTSFLNTKTDTVTLRQYLQKLEKLSSENINEIEITANWIIENAVLKKSDNILATALVILGDTYLNAQKLKEAAEVYLRVITLTENSSNYIDLSKAYIGMYNFNKQSGDYDKAMAFITKCLTVSEKNNYKPGIAKSKYGTAALFDDQSYPEKKRHLQFNFQINE
jgi:tetratricopeptide (TPR) repeat protein